MLIPAPARKLNYGANPIQLFGENERRQGISGRFYISRHRMSVWSGGPTRRFKIDAEGTARTSFASDPENASTSSETSAVTKFQFPERSALETLSFDADLRSRGGKAIPDHRLRRGLDQLGSQQVRAVEKNEWTVIYVAWSKSPGYIY